MNKNTLYEKTNILVITGGVFSSLGKGITASSIGCLLQNLGFKVINLKFDPYVNVDPGTMNPLQHGEVFVTADGGETDLDLGNYERFLNIDLTKLSNLTTGKIYQDVINKERNGDYLGKTVQIIPHITDEIINHIYKNSQFYQPDFIVIEVGGTVGDFESIPFIEAMRQLGTLYKNRILYLHCVPLISLLTSNETKTKPLQHSVRELMHAGISPDFLLIRSENGLTKDDKQKIYLTTGVDQKYLIDIKNQKYIYDLVTDLYKQLLHKLILDKLNNKTRINSNYFKKWEKFINLVHAEKKYNAKIALIGKYISNDDAYLSLANGLMISSWYENTDLEIAFIDSSKINKRNVSSKLSKFDAIIIPGGFGEANTAGMIDSIEYARVNKIPFLGICLGMQLACIEYARNVLNMQDATSQEFNKRAKNKIIHLIEGKDETKNLGGTLRLGNYECFIDDKNSLAYKIYQSDKIIERHRHRYEFNNQYEKIMQENGFIFSGVYKDKDLKEIIELPQKTHPFYLATQFHPEFTAKTLKPQLIFNSLIKECRKLKK